MIELDTNMTHGARIRVVGVGGGGGNAINSMITRGLTGVDFIAANTDIQALANNQAPIKVQVGKEGTRGLGAGADPSIGNQALDESAEEIRQVLSGSDMIFVTAGMGGGTGTGGAPVVAKIGRELGALVVGIVTKPFNWEAKKRGQVAEQGIEELRRHVDALIVIPNQKLMSIIDKKTTFTEAFQKVDDVLYNATRGIADIISGHGYINVDFADVRTIMKNTGDAIMGTGVATGDHRAVEAAENAISSPLLEGVSIQGAQGVLVNITGGSNMTMFEIGEAVSVIEEAAGPDVNLIHGIVFDDSMDDTLMVTVVATGFRRVEDIKQQHQVSIAAAVAEQKEKAAATVQQQQSQRVAAEQQREAAMPRYAAAGGNAGGQVQSFYTPNIPSTPPPSRSVPMGSPSGVQELQRYDEPAYLRRKTSGNGSIRISAGTERNEAPAERPNETPEEERKDVREKPAFLRKIMD